MKFMSLTALLAFFVSPLFSEAFSPSTSSKPLHVLDATKMTDDRMTSTYDSLSDRLLKRYESENNLRNNQLFVCIAGGPGSGKSTLASAVAERLNSQMSKNGTTLTNQAAVVLPMDGFHYTRAELKSMGESDDHPYNYEDLIARRGAPWTFDAEGCIKAFSAARRDGEASLPIYSREKSDPVPDGVRLYKDTKIVLLEGNYLLAWGDERWAPLQSIFDETWFISCESLENQRQRLVYRHLETWTEEKTKIWGEGEEGAGKKADANDMLNAEWVDKTSRKFADLVVESL